MTGSKESFIENFSAASNLMDLRSQGKQYLADLPVPNRKSEKVEIFTYYQASKFKSEYVMERCGLARRNTSKSNSF